MLERELGRGGMATVYLARDLASGTRVAVKVLRPELVPVLGSERFAREVRITSSLEHPNILPVLDSGQTKGGLPFYVTPYIEGESLAELLKRRGQLPIPHAIEITCEIASALQAAHACGFVHRDIKPSNILLTNGRAILADFGIARAVDVAAAAAAERLTETGVSLGTPAYMSPEQSSCGLIDGRGDIYSLGCVLFEMLAGTPPFSGLTAQSLQARHALDPPPRLRTVRPTVPSSLEEVVDTALAKVPGDRFQSATAFADALAGHAKASPRPRFPTKWLLGAAGLMSVASGLWFLAERQLEPLDPNKVVVFPLVQRSGGALRVGAGEEVSLLIGSALEHSEPLKWIDGWPWLGTTFRANAALLDARTARRIARSRGAQFYIDGAVLASADSNTVIVRLNDVQGDSLLGQATSSGRAEQPLAQLGLTAISQLLPRLLAPGRTVDFAPLSERQPAAIANWLQGEREYRQSQYVRALEYYRRAVEEDSALALAALNGAQAADWIGEDDDARAFVAAALTHEVNLPRKYAHLTWGLHYFLEGSADSAAARYRLALGLDPAWAKAWTALGDVYYHLLPGNWPLDSLAEAAFTAARRADPDDISPLYHLTEIALHRGALARALPMLAAFRRSNPDPTWTLQLELMASCRGQGPKGMDWGKAVEQHSLEVFYAAKALAAAGAHWGCSEGAFRRLLGSDSIDASYKRASLLMLQSILVAQRRYSEATDLIDSAVARGETDARSLYVVDAIAGAPFERQAEAVLDRLPDGTQTLQGPRLWFQGAWYAHTGDVPRLTEAIERQRRRAQSTAAPADSLLAELLAARLDLARADTGEAVERLAALRSAAGRARITWGFWQSLADERMVLAEILLAKGEPSRVMEVASAFDHFEPAVYVMYWPRSLGVRLRAAIMMGRLDLAERYATRLREIGRQDLLNPVGNDRSPLSHSKGPRGLRHRS